MYDYGIIGNCHVAALVSRAGSMDWLCLPRPDSPPIFGRLLDADGGHFDITSPNRHTTRQEYVENTNVLRTVFEDEHGNSFAVTDFAPRFEQYDRMFRPPTIVRIVTPLSGHPLVQANIRVVKGWSKEEVKPHRGNSHIRYNGFDDLLRLTTNTPLTYLLENQSFALQKELYFILTWGLPVEDDVEAVAHKFLRNTIRHWRTWVMRSSIPPFFQKEAIRSALTLKLHCYEDTGAILAAITTSLPEEVGAVRNWDYRYCWLRDAYFSVSSFYKLGYFEELDGILNFLYNVLTHSDIKRLNPVYRLDGTLPLPEINLEHWDGLEGTKPVRVGNQAAEHVQNDAYGEMLMTLTPLYFDERFTPVRSAQTDEMLHILARRCADVLTEPDAGLWELREGWKVHSFTLLLCWAGLERYARLIAEKRLSGDLAQALAWKQAADDALRSCIQDGVMWNSASNRIADASSLLLAALRYPDKRLLENTVNEVLSSLGLRAPGETKEKPPVFFFRYRHHDDFGVPHHAFVICTFWMVEALAALGRQEEARYILEQSLKSANHLGLFAEHYDLDTKEQRGNFPQCYSHVGLIHAAFAVSPDWEDIL